MRSQTLCLAQGQHSVMMTNMVLLSLSAADPGTCSLEGGEDCMTSEDGTRGLCAFWGHRGRQGLSFLDIEKHGLEEPRDVLWKGL